MLVIRAFDNASKKLERICRETGRSSDIQRILSRNRKLNINMLVFGEHTLLHLATMHNFAECVQVLINNGANVASCVKSSGNTCLHMASWSGNLEIVKIICSHDNNHVDAVSNDQFTALSLACWAGHLELCQFLLSIGASSSIKNRHGYTPLLLAARCGSYQVVEHLIESNACDVNEIDNDGCTALHHACFEGRKDLARLLLKLGAEAHLTDKLGRTAKDFCKTRDISDLLGSIRTMTKSYNARTTFKVRLSDCLDKSRDEYRYMSQQKEALSKQYLKKMSQRANQSCVGELAGSHVFASPRKTTNYDSSDDDQSFLGLRSCVHVAPSVARECWRLCESSGDYRALKRLFLAHPSITEGNPTALSHLRDVSNWTLLMRAADTGFLEIVRLLVSIDSGSVNLSCSHGVTPLHLAAARGHEQVVRLLLSIISPVGNADNRVVAVDRKSNRGRTALHEAAEYGFVDIARLLLYRGADENSQDNDGFTPLHLACKYSHTEVIIFLLTECSTNPLAITVSGEIVEDLTKNTGVRRLLRAVTFHRKKSKSDLEEYSHESAQAWSVVETAVKELRGSSKPKNDESLPSAVLDGQNGITELKTDKKSHAKKLQFKHIGDLVLNNKNSVRKVTAKDVAIAGFLELSQRAKHSILVKEEVAIVPTSNPKTPVRMFENGKSHAKVVKVLPKTTVNTNMIPIHDNNMSVRARLKQKYKLAQEHGTAATATNESSSNIDQSRNDKDSSGGAVEGASFVTKSDLQSIGDPASPPEFSSTRSSTSSNDDTTYSYGMNKPFNYRDKSNKEDKMQDGAEWEGDMEAEDEDVDKVELDGGSKELRGSLLLTLILSQVYNVYSNKISRAFYRWKHRSQR